MREIKFRAWIEKHGHMTTNFNVGKTVNDTFKSDGVKFMQFTGRKDKYDVDIYDGDIVKVAECIGGNYIDYCRTKKRVSWNRFGWCLQPVDRDISSPSGLYLSDGESWTVIGNIHQNPELLES